MTAEPGTEDAHTKPVGEMAEGLESYLETLAEEQEVVEAILADLEDAPDEEALTREEYRQVFPATMPLEERGGSGGR